MMGGWFNEEDYNSGGKNNEPPKLPKDEPPATISKEAFDMLMHVMLYGGAVWHTPKNFYGSLNIKDILKKPNLDLDEEWLALQREKGNMV